MELHTITPMQLETFQTPPSQQFANFNHEGARGGAVAPGEWQRLIESRRRQMAKIQQAQKAAVAAGEWQRRIEFRRRQLQLL